MKKLWLWRAVALGISGVVFISGVAPLPVSAAKTTNVVKTLEKAKAEKSVRFMVNGIQYAFSDLNFEKTSAKQYKLKKDEQCMTFQYQVTNTGKTDFALTAMTLFTLKDSDENLYGLTLPEGKNSLNGVLKPGKSQIGYVRFTVSREVAKYSLLVTPSINQSSNALLNLSSEGFNLLSVTEESMAKQSANTASGKSLKVTTATIKATNGSRVALNGLSYTVEKAEIEAVDGRSCVALTLKLENTTKTQKAVTAINQFSLVDENGKTYTLRLPEPVDSLNGLIDPEKTLKGKLLFEVPEGKSTFTLTVKNS